MSQLEKKLKVFIASPSDLNEERQFINDICVELNSVWGDLLGINLNPIKWETDIYPGVSTYSQNVINEQINGDFDIFIAMFWNRFGTPTANSESGTLEELDLALKKYLHENNSIDIMIYFKKQENTYDDKEQQEKVLNLKDNLRMRNDVGILYWEFENIEDFKSLIRIHLSRVIQKWVKKYNLSENNQINAFFESNKTKLQLNEYLEIALGRSDIIGMLTSNILNVRKYFLTASNEFIKKFTKISNDKKLNKRDELDKIINIFTVTMDDTTNIIEAQLSPIVYARNILFNALSKVVSINIITNKKEYLALKISIEKLYRSNQDAIKNIQEDINRWNNIPDITNEFRISKRNMLISLEKYKQHLSSVVILSEEILALINDIEN